MIPRQLHYCWFGGPMPSRVMARIETWERIMPDWPIHRWSEADLNIEASPVARHALAKGHWSSLSDWARCVILHAWGGAYFDTDIEAVRPLDPLLHHRCVLGFQAREPFLHWVDACVILAEPGCAFLQSVLYLTAMYFARDGYIHIIPEVVTTALRELGLSHYGRQDIGEVTLLPVEAFYPYSFRDQYRPECVTPETFAVHHWDGTWHARKEYGPA